MKKAVRCALIACAWLALWALAARLVDKPLLLPGPLLTARTLGRLVLTADFWSSAGMTLLRVGVGFLCAVALGGVLGALCAFWEWARAFLTPVKRVLRATPVTSFIILVLLWLRTDMAPAFIAFLMVTPMIWENVETGIQKTDPSLLEMARAYRLTGAQKAKEIYWPSVQPYLASASMTGLGFAWKSGVAAEVIARPLNAIGSKLQDAKVYLETPELFAWTAVVVLLSMLLEFALKRLTAGLSARRHG